MKLIGAMALGFLVAYALGAFTGSLPEKKEKKAKRKTSDTSVWLRQAGLDMSARQFWMASSFLGAVAFLFLSIITGSGAIAVVPAVAVTFVPRMYFGKRRGKRMQKVLQEWPDAIREVVGSIQANLSLHGALIELARSGPESIRTQFARFPTLASTLGVVPALEIIREEMADPTSDRVIEVLILAHERGGGIVGEILSDLARATTQDIRVLEEIENDALEQKINARAVFVLPWAMLIILTLQDGPFRIFYASPGGLVVVVIAAILSIIGIVWVNHLGKDPVEQRVFGDSATSSTEVAA